VIFLKIRFTESPFDRQRNKGPTIEQDQSGGTRS
jgi:hypothetical protein